jgi:5'-3' exoribonuclease 1
MGIKHFFQWFKTQFRSHVKNMRRGQDLESINVSIDNLMIDMNGIFHASAQKIYEYGNHKPNPRLLRTNNRRNNGREKQVAMFEDVCRSIEHIFKIAKPKKRLILCVDGPAPLSKQNQQRQRRFRSAVESSDGKCPFNSNCITPGTKFMDFLTKYIDWYIQKRINEDESWRGIEVIFSNEKAPGEGEHKIINYIRYYGDIGDTYCINGMDADLIMLALGTHVPNFYILREDAYDLHNDFFCLDIGSIRKELASILRWTSQEEGAFVFNERTSIDDFIFLCFMVGNDFLPHIPSIEIIERGIELILEVYKETGMTYGHITHLKDDRVEFLPIPLGIFLEKIGMYEKENLEGKLSKKKDFFPDPLLESCAEQNSDTDKWDVDIEKYKKEYYTYSFPPLTEEKVLCHDYLEGMQWVLSYYTRGVPNWKWNFRYHYAPCASVLSRHVKSFSHPKYVKTIPSTPFQQLLCVLPPKSADLIPEPLCRLLTDSKSPLKKQCPEQFEVDLRGKRKEWEGVVILPMVDFNLVRDCYLKLIGKVSPQDLKRNITGRSYKYEYVSGLPRTFKSYYGDIENCSVNTVFIDL